jgi:hypothetical protein
MFPEAKVLRNGKRGNAARMTPSGTRIRGSEGNKATRELVMHSARMSRSIYLAL